MKRIISIILAVFIIASLAGCNAGKPKFVQNLFSTNTELSEVKNVFSKSYNLDIEDLNYFRYYDLRLAYWLGDIIQYRAANENDYHFLLYNYSQMIPLTPNVLSEYSNTDYTAIYFPLDENYYIYVLLDSSGKLLRYFDNKNHVASLEYNNDYVTKLQDGHYDYSKDLNMFFDINNTIELSSSYYQYEYNDDYTLSFLKGYNSRIKYNYDNNGYRESKTGLKYYRDSDGLVIAYDDRYNNHYEIKYLPSGYIDHEASDYWLP